MTRVCKQCLIEKPWIKGQKNSSGRFVYYHDDGTYWRGKSCYACTRVIELNRYDRNYKRDRVSTRYKPHAKAVKAELLSKKFLEGLGFDVEHTRNAGPDLRLRKGQVTLTCEVKSVIKVNCHGRSTFYSDYVAKNRMHDDLVSVVFDDGTLVLDTMEQHLNACSKGGRRSLTRLLRKIEDGSFKISDHNLRVLARYC